MKPKIETVFVLAKVLEQASSAWFFGTYVIFLTAAGLTLLQANLLNVVFMSVSTLFDPFTGNLADKIGQKKVYLFGLFFWGTGMLVYGLNHTFAMFAVAEGTSAIGHALIFEALESWLRNHTSEKVTRVTSAKAQTWAKMATIPAALSGAFIGSKYGLSWPWILAGLSSFVALMLIWFLSRHIPERPKRWQVTSVPGVWAMIKIMIKNRILKRVVVIYAVVAAAVMPFNMFWQIVLRDAGGKPEWMGSVWIGIALLTALGAKLSARIRNGFRSLWIPVVFIGLPLIGAAFVPNLWLILGLFFTHEIGRGMWPLVVFNYSNRHIKSGVRSTVNSIRSTAGTIGGVVGLLVSGILTEVINPRQVWTISALVLLVVTLWVRRQRS